MQSADTLDPEQELRKRLQTRLTQANPADPIGFGPSDLPTSGEGVKAAPFLPVDGGSPDPIDRPGQPWNTIPPGFGQPNPNKPAPMIPPGGWPLTTFPNEAQPKIPPMTTQAVMPRAGDPTAPPTPAPATAAAPVVPIQPVAPPPMGTPPPMRTTMDEHEPATPPPAPGSPNPTLPAPPAPATPPPPGGVVVTPGFRAQVNAAYQKYYHRDATEGELISHAGNPGGIDAVIAALEASLPAGGGGGGTTGGPQGGDFRGWFQGLTGGKPPTPDTLKSLEAQLNANGITIVGPGKIRLSSGIIVDVIQNAATGGSAWQWLQNDQGGGGGSAGGGGSPSPAGSASTVSPFLAQLRALLMERIAAAEQPVDQNSAQIADPLSAARDEVSRGQDQERKALAERLYATGSLNSGELTQGIQQSAERNATGLSQLRAGLISKEYTARRDELQNYMQLAIASGDAEMARQVQLEIANLNASVQRQGLGISLAEFIASLNQNTANAAAGR